MPKVMLLVAQDFIYDEVGPFVQAFIRFTTAMHCDPSVLTLGTPDDQGPPWWEAHWHEAMLLHSGIVVVIPSSSLRPIYLRVAEQLLFPKTLCPIWIVHGDGGAADAAYFEEYLDVRSAVLFPRLHCTAAITESALVVHGLRFLNFSFAQRNH